jgi:hypothetical protein
MCLAAPCWAAPERPDPTVLQLINQDRPDDQQVKADQVRVVRPASFPEVTLVGFLVGTNECLLGSAVIGNQPMTPAEASGVALRQRGWETADNKEKTRLSLLWVQEALLGFGETMLDKKPEGFGGRDVRFKEPEVLCTMSGAVRVIVWLEEPPSGNNSRHFRRNLYWFDKAGHMIRGRILERYEMLVSSLPARSNLVVNRGNVASW